MKRKALLVEVERQLASSPNECQNVKFQLLYLHFIFRSLLCIYYDGSMKIVQNKQPRKVLANFFGHNIEQP